MKKIFILLTIFTSILIISCSENFISAEYNAKYIDYYIEEDDQNKFYCILKYKTESFFDHDAWATSAELKINEKGSKPLIIDNSGNKVDVILEKHDDACQSRYYFYIDNVNPDATNEWQYFNYKFLDISEKEYKMYMEKEGSIDDLNVNTIDLKFRIKFPEDERRQIDYL